jgi:hypothetical protein
MTGETRSVPESLRDHYPQIADATLGTRPPQRSLF